MVFAYFGDMMVWSVQPQVLNVALLRGFFLYHDTGCVVRSQLVRANASGSGTCVFRRPIQRYRLETLWVIWTDGAANNEKQCFAWGCNSQCGLCTNWRGIEINALDLYTINRTLTKGWADVQAISFLVRNPMLVDAYKLLQQFNHSVTVEGLGKG